MHICLNILIKFSGEEKTNGIYSRYTHELHRLFLSQTVKPLWQARAVVVVVVKVTAFGKSKEQEVG